MHASTDLPVHARAARLGWTGSRRSLSGWLSAGCSCPRAAPAARPPARWSTAAGSRPGVGSARERGIDTCGSSSGGCLVVVGWQLLDAALLLGQPDGRAHCGRLPSAGSGASQHEAGAASASPALQGCTGRPRVQGWTCAGRAGRRRCRGLPPSTARPWRGRCCRRGALGAAHLPQPWAQQVLTAQQGIKRGCWWRRIPSLHVSELPCRPDSRPPA